MRMGSQPDTKLFLLEFQLHTNCRQKEECHESESGHSAENACCHLARVECDGVPYNDYKKPEAIAEGNS